MFVTQQAYLPGKQEKFLHGALRLDPRSFRAWPIFDGQELLTPLVKENTMGHIIVDTAS